MKMLKIKDAANETGLSVYCIRKLAKSGQIKALRSGKSTIYISMQSLNDYLQNAYLNETQTEPKHGIRKVVL